MKQHFLFFAVAMSLFIACGKKNNKTVVTGEPETFVAKKELHIEGSPLRLPAGTRVTKSADGFELQVELPEGYSFLAGANVTQSHTQTGLWPTIPATYKCKCSGDNACQVFYQEDAGGFGCLHKSCSGSCTGSFTILQQDVNGIVRTVNNELSARKDIDFAGASLTSKGYEVFFSNTVIQKAIEEQYEKMYARMPKPDFKNLRHTGVTANDYVFLKVTLYGVPFFMIAPEEITAYGDFVETVPLAKAMCQCDSNKGACEMKSWSMMGLWATYWCEGDCNACELTVSQLVTDQ